MTTVPTALRTWIRDDRGSAVVEFALVVPLVLVVAVGVLQVALALHVRSTLTAAAAEGARAGALAYSNAGVAERRTRSILDGALGGDTVEDVEVSRTRIDGTPVVRVAITARLPLVGLLGPTAMTVEGHAMEERP
ncbi:MAG: TadE/TadG family type IV pilus assembly protein [Candidatus Nanopelagicales bacterium]